MICLKYPLSSVHVHLLFIGRVVDLTILPRCADSYTWITTESGDTAAIMTD